MLPWIKRLSESTVDEAVYEFLKFHQEKLDLEP